MTVAVPNARFKEWFVRRYSGIVSEAISSFACDIVARRVIHHRAITIIYWSDHD